MSLSFSRIRYLLQNTAIVGVGIVAIWVGYALFTDRTHFKLASFITKILLLVPHIGSPVVSWLWDGFSVDNPQLSHFYLAYGLFVAAFIGIVLWLVSGTHKKPP